MQKSFNRMSSACFKQALSAGNVGIDKWRSIENTAIDMRLGGKIHDRPRPLFLKNPLDGGSISDVAVHKAQAFVWDIGQVFQVAGVGKLVEIDDPPAWLGAKQPNKVTADKTAAAGHQYRFHANRYLPVQSNANVTKVIISILE